MLIKIQAFSHFVYCLLANLILILYNEPNQALDFYKSAFVSVCVRENLDL